jgi:ABC-type dipeptide/oligopeptide/nickel transport system ATPase component
MHFFTPGGVVRAVNGVSFTIKRGEIVGLVGESGCGKSVTALSLLGLVNAPGRVVSGEITFLGRNLRTATSREPTRGRAARRAAM